MGEERLAKALKSLCQLHCQSCYVEFMTEMCACNFFIDVMLCILVCVCLCSVMCGE